MQQQLTPPLPPCMHCKACGREGSCGFVVIGGKYQKNILEAPFFLYIFTIQISLFCVYVYVHVHTYALVLTGECAYDGWKSLLGVFLNCSLPYFSRQGLSLKLILTHELDSLTMELQDLPVFAPWLAALSALRLQIHTQVLSTKHQVLARMPSP